HESGVTDTADALGGSWAIEQLTDELEAKAMDYLRRIDDMGGMVRAIEQGFPQSEIQDAAFTAQRELDQNEQAVVGANARTLAPQRDRELLPVNEQVERAQTERPAARPTKRDPGATDRSRAALRRAAGTPDEHHAPRIGDAVTAYAT